MSFFTDPHEESTSVGIDQAATGPKVGFLESFEVGYNEQVRGSAAYGIEDKMWQLDSEQTRALRKAGVENVPSLSPDSMGFLTSNLPGPAAGVDTYLDVAKFYVDGGSPEFSDRLQEYDQRITDLREKFPELKLRTSGEMFETVKSQAQEYERRAELDRRTFGGSTGMFIGGAVGALNPNTDPLNFITAPIGGAGKTIVGRVAGQGAAQGFIEGVNQITGVQEQRRLLGLSHGFGDAVSRTLGAAVGGAALQGVGEAAVFGVRRWFKNSPTDAAPAPGATERPPLPDTKDIPEGVVPADGDLAAAQLTRDPTSLINHIHETSPLSGTRAGKARTVLDLDYVDQRLTEWEGPRPWELAPKTDTAPVRPANDFTAPDMRVLAEKSQLADMAERVDPDTMRKFNSLAKSKRDLRAEIEAINEGATEALTVKLNALDDKLYKLQQEKDAVGGRGAMKTKRAIKKVQDEKSALIEASGEPVEAQALRRALMKQDEKMRDLAPLVSRAYARANQKWDNGAAEREAVYKMVREGREKPPEVPEGKRIAEAVESQLADLAPILRDADKVADVVKKDADAADVATAVIARNEKMISEAVDAYRNTLDEILSVEKNGDINIAGQDYKLNLDTDRVFVPDDAGGAREMSIREVLEENKQVETELEAVSSCSIR